MRMKGNRIKELREAKGEERRDLAVALDVSELTVGKWERGEGGMPVSRLQALADHFGVSTDEVLGRTRAAA